MLMGEVHLLKRAGQVSDFTGHALLGSLQGRGGGATMLSGSLQAFDGHTPPPVWFLSCFLLLFSFLSRSQEAGRNGGARGRREKRGAEASMGLGEATTKCNMCLCNAQW